VDRVGQPAALSLSGSFFLCVAFSIFYLGGGFLFFLPFGCCGSRAVLSLSSAGRSIAPLAVVAVVAVVVDDDVVVVVRAGCNGASDGYLRSGHTSARRFFFFSPLLVFTGFCCYL